MELDLLQIPRLLRARWRSVLAAVVLTGLLTVGVVVMMPRDFEAKVVLVPVDSRVSAGPSAGLTSSLLSSVAGGLGGADQGGIRALTLSAYGQLDGTLTSVAFAKAGRDSALVGSGLIGKPIDGWTRQRVLHSMRRHLSFSVDRTAGFVSMRVTGMDTAAVRGAVSSMIHVLEATYGRTQRAQAQSVASALSSRVDSLRLAFESAQEDQRAFASSHLRQSTVSPGASQFERLSLARELAQSRYLDAERDYSVARNRLLEATPAIVVVDPAPAKLEPSSRRMLIKLFSTVALGMMLQLLFFMRQSALRER